MVAIDQNSGDEIRGLTRTLTYMTDRGFRFGTLFSLKTDCDNDQDCCNSISVGDVATFDNAKSPFS